MSSQTAAPIIVLSDLQPIAAGRRQNVYEHPSDPTALVKVPKPETCDDQGNLLQRRLTDRFRRATAFGDFLREIREYLELKARHPQPGVELPLCEVRGLVQTDLGVGLVYERISDPDGSLAPTLKALIASGRAGARQIDELDAHFRDLREKHVVLSNFNLDNVVYQTRPDGTGRFVWVDSIGCKQFVPTRRWFRRMNDRKLSAIEDHCLKAIRRGMRRSEIPKNRTDPVDQPN